MRIGYSEDEERPGQFALWQANCDRSLRGKAGQAALREIEEALLALPTKRLVSGVLDDGADVCAIGALARHKGHTPKADPEFEMEYVGMEMGLPRLVAWKVVCLNDVEIDGFYAYAEGPDRHRAYPSYAEHRGVWTFFPYTPEQRYEKVLAWVRAQLKATTDGH